MREKAEEHRAQAAAEQADVVAAIGSGLEALASGDVSHRLHVVFAAEYEQLRGNFNAAMEQLEDLLRGVVSNTNAIRSGSGEITIQETTAASHSLASQAEELARMTGHFQLGELPGEARAAA